METTLIVLLVIALLSIIFRHTYEIVESHKYYKRLKEYHNLCVEELKGENND